MLLNGGTLGVNFAKFGPFGLRAAMLASRLEDVVVQGVVVKRRVNGPTSLREWTTCWKIFGNCCLALKACRKGPLDEYEKKIRELDALLPGRFSIILHADFVNRYEKWPDYREEIERMVNSHNEPEFYDATKPLGAIFHRAANDDKFWELHVEKPCAKPTLDEACQAAALQHSDFLPGMNIDAIEDFYAPQGVPGAYSRRTPAGTPRGQQPPWEAARNPQQWSAANDYIPPTTGDTHADGRLKLDPASKLRICFERNITKQPGCSPVCPRSLAHVCEFCGNPSHTTVSCKSRPKGYVHPYRGSGKGKGATPPDASKGKGKGTPHPQRRWPEGPLHDKGTS